ncbi:hypothetical protein U27_03854 [Candidatus Vecturithrix granuli]|uniref:FecR protein domain-containing protein n=1 Tax=Vecturithrix granuli TaxID=1499967 RepID=A0A081BX35_VECG1|nr:hypothetical protein U27_03854 [Candidatus Vecturithrix granuli]
MKIKGCHNCILALWGWLCFLIVPGMWLSATSAEATLTPQAMSGTVEVLLPGEQAWKPLTAVMQLKAGDQIRTSPGSAVELWFDDGSLVRLEEVTLLVITELEVSIAKKTRIARFSLQKGVVSAKITKLGFTESLCEIATDSVVVEMKFAEVEVKVLEGEGQTFVTALQGELDLVKTREGEIMVSGMLDDQEGMIFSLAQIGTKIRLGVQRIVRKIVLEGEGSIQGLRTMLGDNDNTLKVDNAGTNPVEVAYSGIIARLDQDRAATFGIPRQGGLLLNLVGQMNIALWYKDRTTQYEGLYVFADKGPIYVNGKMIETGSFEYWASDQIQGTSRALAVPQEKTPAARTLTQPQEQPVAPPPPDSGSPQGSREPTPTPTPTSTPTPMPTPRPTPTPTATPKLPSPPTPTPASPIQP